MKNIQIPEMNTNKNISIPLEKNMVIVGANGAGKTRFGSKLEQINNPSKRISAQRYLQINDIVEKKDYETAYNQLNSAYKNKPPIQPQNDFQHVLISLFAQESRRNEDAITKIKARGNLSKDELPTSVKEQVVEIWNFVFPYRELNLEKDKIQATSDSQKFSGSEMSDGEKVGLYLISQTLLAEKDCLLIVDEPELHLHKSLMVRLWNKIEEYRQDCTFIYITHDLDFAVSKPTSKLLWIKNYQNNMWDFVELEPNDIIPENLYLEVLGSRKPILFVEGEKGSLDVQVYQAFYEDFTIIPHGSCEKVIESVKGLRGNKSFHNKDVFGIIDKDFRPSEQLQSLQKNGVFSISLNEIENIFLVPEIIDLVCKYLSKTDKKDKIIDEIRKQYEFDKDQITFANSKYAIQRMLNEKFGAVRNKEQFNSFKTMIIGEMEQLISEETLPKEDDDIVELLKVYPHKGLVKKIQSTIELSKNGYQNLVISFFATDKRNQILTILKNFLPNITN